MTLTQPAPPQHNTQNIEARITTNTSTDTRTHTSQHARTKSNPQHKSTAAHQHQLPHNKTTSPHCNAHTHTLKYSLADKNELEGKPVLDMVDQLNIRFSDSRRLNMGQVVECSALATCQHLSELSESHTARAKLTEIAPSLACFDAGLLAESDLHKSSDHGATIFLKLFQHLCPIFAD